MRDYTYGKLVAWQTPTRQVLIDLDDCADERITLVIGWVMVMSPMVIGLGWLFGLIAGLM